MAYRLKKDVLKSIHAREHSRGDTKYTIYEAFLGTKADKSQVRLASKSEAKLKELIADFYKKLAEGGQVATTFNEYEAADARKALDLLAQKKSTLSLYDCVRRATDDSARAAECTVTVSDAYARFMAAQTGKSEAYIKTLRSHLNQWTAEFGVNRMLSEITAAEVASKLRARVIKKEDPSTKKTYNNHLGDIKTFVSWCAKPEQAFIPRSPLEGMSKLTIVYEDPKYLSPSQVRELFKVLCLHREEAPADLADAIASFFCGMRQIEIERIRLGDGAVRVSIEDKFIRVVKCKGATKGIRPRSFTLPDIAYAWATKVPGFDFVKAIHTPNPQFRRNLVQRAKEAGIKDIPENAGRHTFITMYTAAFHDHKTLSSIVGNTEGVRARSYDGVEIEKNGREYFNITPESVMG